MSADVVVLPVRRGERHHGNIARAAVAALFNDNEAVADQFLIGLWLEGFMVVPVPPPPDTETPI